jgi:hypothetical protein
LWRQPHRTCSLCSQSCGRSCATRSFWSGIWCRDCTANSKAPGQHHLAFHCDSAPGEAHRGGDGPPICWWISRRCSRGCRPGPTVRAIPWRSTGRMLGGVASLPTASVLAQVLRDRSH